MPVRLLDVNVLVALLWAKHVHHPMVRSWFDAHVAEGWATCPITQAGFVRISSNPKVVEQALTPSEAVSVISETTAHPRHLFLPDDLSVADALGRSTLTGHRQVTDGYLVALAVHHGGHLATLDKAIAAANPSAELIA